MAGTGVENPVFAGGKSTSPSCGRRDRILGHGGADNVAGTPGGIGDEFEMRFEGGILGVFDQQTVRVTPDDGDDIIQFMGHVGRYVFLRIRVPDGFHRGIHADSRLLNFYAKVFN
jgi:hypothetical protein